MRRAWLLLVVLSFMSPLVANAFEVTFGSSWDNVPLQEILNAEYGPGVIDVTTDYEGYLSGDADPPYWLDATLEGLVVREIAGYRNRNVLGWYVETLTGPPVIDGVDDGVVFEGSASAGATVTIDFPNGITQFGFYMNPNGPYDSGINAPEPEMFFTNRFYNDLGPDGSGSPHAPFDGDPQVLIYNLTNINAGVPTYVLAWEDLDYGGNITPSGSAGGTDNDFQDMVVEIQAISPVKTEAASWGSLKALFRE